MQVSWSFKIILGSLYLCCVTFVYSANVSEDVSSAKTEGGRLYQTHCARCHDGNYSKAPFVHYLRMMTPQSIYGVLTEGVMQAQAAALKPQEKEKIVLYLTGKRLSDQAPVNAAVQCPKDSDWFDYSASTAIHGWGVDLENTRFVPEAISRLPAADVKQLRLKWVFAYPNAQRARSQPSVAGGGLFVGSHSGDVFALDAKSGCQHWVFKAAGEVRTAIVVEPWKGHHPRAPGQVPSLFFGDTFANIYAINAQTGQLRWKTKVDDHPAATITGSPTYYKGQVLVPLAAMGNLGLLGPGSSCCTNRGAVLALDAASGNLNWKTYTIPDRAVEQYREAQGIPQYGPAGASVMTTPTIDEKRGLRYVGTGQNHVSPADDNSDAIFALSLDDGRVIWKRQTTKGDTVPGSPLHPNYKNEVHLDFDFSASPILIKVKGDQDILVAGQKSGEVFGLDPDTGSIVWRNKVGRGGIAGGVHFGMATEGRKLFVPIHDSDFLLSYIQPPLTESAKPGLYALDIMTGKKLWERPIAKDCAGGQTCEGYSAAVTAIPGVVFAARRDGELQAFASDSGQLLWSTSTAKPYMSLNGDTARGGSIGAAGPVVADGVVYVNSGYGLYEGLPGNVLLAFSVNGR